MSDEKDPEQAKFVVPPVLVGTKQMAQWLCMINIPANVKSVRAKVRQHGISVKALDQDHRICVYERPAILALVRWHTGVEPSRWIACGGRMEQVEKGAAAVDTRLFDTSPRTRVLNSKVYAAIVPQPGNELNQEAVLVDPSGRTFLSRDATKVAQWDCGWWPGPWSLRAYEYAVPCMNPYRRPRLTTPSGRLRDRRAITLLGAMRLDEDGFLRAVRVPAPMLGWRSIDKWVKCIFAPANQHRERIIQEVERQKIGEVFWFLWVRPTVLRPVTLDPIKLPRKRQKSLRSIDPLTEPNAADFDVLVKDLSAEEGEEE